MAVPSNGKGSSQLCRLHPSIFFHMFNLLQIEYIYLPSRLLNLDFVNVSKPDQPTSMWELLHLFAELAGLPPQPNNRC